MRSFVEIDGANKVKCVWPWGVPGLDPVFEAGYPQPIEITGLSPLPDVGWTYDPSTGIFTP